MTNLQKNLMKIAVFPIIYPYYILEALGANDHTRMKEQQELKSSD
jgi:hypothetical protein